MMQVEDLLEALFLSDFEGVYNYLFQDELRDLIETAFDNQIELTNELCHSNRLHVSDFDEPEEAFDILNAFSDAGFNHVACQLERLHAHGA
jgi:hypothetical protein